MEATDIESFSINYLKLEFAKCPRIIAEIADNDKTPSWDGTIYLYRSDVKKNPIFTENVKFK